MKLEPGPTHTNIYATVAQQGAVALLKHAFGTFGPIIATQAHRDGPIEAAVAALAASWDYTPPECPMVPISSRRSEPLGLRLAP